ncbi:MAG: glycosyltransferase [Candidatus Gracilibacteria bacterium]
MHKVLIGLNTYNDLPLLRESLPVLEELRMNLPADVAILDTAHNDGVRDFIKKKFPEFKYLRHHKGNVGYGQSYNEILRQNPGYKYLLVVTSDVLLDTAIVKKFVERMEEGKNITMCAGKLHHWDSENHRKTEQIDSLGIVAEKRHHFYDRGHGEMDTGQYDDVLEAVFGISGAVFLIRTSVIPKLHGDPAGLFDERMWMYKEDIDLSYRLRWLGEKIVVFPEVWGWHARTVANKEGKSLSALTKADQKKRDYGRLHSYKNHFLLLKNNFTWRYGIGVLLRVAVYEILKAFYMLLRHPKVFFAGLKVLLFIPGERSTRAVSAREMLSYFQ